MCLLVTFSWHSHDFQLHINNIHSQLNDVIFPKHSVELLELSVTAHFTNFSNMSTTLRFHFKLDVITFLTTMAVICKLQTAKHSHFLFLRNSKSCLQVLFYENEKLTSCTTLQNIQRQFVIKLRSVIQFSFSKTDCSPTKPNLESWRISKLEKQLNLATKLQRNEFVGVIDIKIHTCNNITHFHFFIDNGR